MQAFDLNRVIECECWIKSQKASQDNKEKGQKIISDQIIIRLYW